MNLLKKIMNTITMNGNIVGNNNRSVSIINGKVIIDGKEINSNDKIINIVIEGNVENLQCDIAHKLEIKGNVTNNVETISANVTVNGSVGGYLKSSSGGINCGDVKGDVNTVSGNVKMLNCTGNIKSISGNIKL